MTPLARTLLLATALAPAVAAAPDDPCRVVIVGGGSSGLAAAQTLQRVGCSAVVLEARKELGGRTHTVDTGPFAGIELGAHWVHGGLDNIVSAPLLKYLGIDIIPVGGNDDFEGQRKRMDLFDDSRMLTDAERNASFDLFDQTRNLMIGYLTHTMNATCDGQTACRNLDVSLRDAWDVALSSLRPLPTDKDLRLLDLLMRLKYEQDAGNIMSKLSGRVQSLDGYVDFYPKGGKGDAYVVGGYRSMIDALAHGVEIHLTTPVTAIEVTSEGVLVSTPRGQFSGTHAILTPPPAVLRKIAVQPPLPAWKGDALRRIGAGPVGKALLLLKDTLPLRFWGGAPPPSLYSFAHTGDEASLISFCVYSGAEHPEDPSYQRILECFLGANALHMIESLPDPIRKKRLSFELRQTFGNSSIEVVEMQLTPWDTDPHIGLAWSFPPVGTVAGDFTNASQTTGRLLFAGEGYCRLLFGNVHAALASAARAAYEILPEGLRASAAGNDWPLLRKEIRTACDVFPRGRGENWGDSGTLAEASEVGAETAQRRAVGGPTWV